jgi:hypothetical protein
LNSAEKSPVHLFGHAEDHLRALPASGGQLRGPDQAERSGLRRWLIEHSGLDWAAAAAAQLAVCTRFGSATWSAVALYMAGGSKHVIRFSLSEASRLRTTPSGKTTTGE